MSPTSLHLLTMAEVNEIVARKQSVGNGKVDDGLLSLRRKMVHGHDCLGDAVAHLDVLVDERLDDSGGASSRSLEGEGEIRFCHLEKGGPSSLSRSIVSASEGGDSSTAENRENSEEELDNKRVDGVN
jgi:hypothetical protein